MASILVVDDEPDILKVVSFRLKRAGYNVVSAADGEEALKLVQKEKPDLILLDIRLPSIDGYEICKRIKSNNALKHTPIIFLTASSGARIVDAVKKFKADGYLIKPFEPEELLKAVESIIRLKGEK